MSFRKYSYKTPRPIGKSTFTTLFKLEDISNDEVKTGVKKILGSNYFRQYSLEQYNLPGNRSGCHPTMNEFVSELDKETGNSGETNNLELRLLIEAPNSVRDKYFGQGSERDLSLLITARKTDSSYNFNVEASSIENPSFKAYRNILPGEMSIFRTYSQWHAEVVKELQRCLKQKK